MTLKCVNKQTNQKLLAHRKWTELNLRLLQTVVMRESKKYDPLRWKIKILYSNKCAVQLIRHIDPLCSVTFYIVELHPHTVVHYIISPIVPLCNCTSLLFCSSGPHTCNSVEVPLNEETCSDKKWTVWNAELTSGIRTFIMAIGHIGCFLNTQLVLRF